MLACNNCHKEFKDGDTAYEIDIQKIKIIGENVVFKTIPILECEECNGKSKPKVGS